MFFFRSMQAEAQNSQKFGISHAKWNWLIIADRKSTKNLNPKDTRKNICKRNVEKLTTINFSPLTRFFNQFYHMRIEKMSHTWICKFFFLLFSNLFPHEKLSFSILFIFMTNFIDGIYGQRAKIKEILNQNYFDWFSENRVWKLNLKSFNSIIYPT